jgi:hypothetical protein
VIRLVTQFDDPATHPSVATPSGASSSSCCCCCVATAIGVSVFSTVHIRSRRLQALEKGAEVEPPPAASPWPEVLGCFALAIALGLGALLGWATGGALLVATPFVWGFLLYAAYRGAGADRRAGYASLTVVCALLVAAIEFAIWLAVLS